MRRNYATSLMTLNEHVVEVRVIGNTVTVSFDTTHRESIYFTGTMRMAALAASFNTMNGESVHFIAVDYRNGERLCVVTFEDGYEEGGTCPGSISSAGEGAEFITAYNAERYPAQ